MLAVIKKSDITHDILLDNNEQNELRSLTLPVGWWHTTLSHDLEKSKRTLKILKFSDQKKRRNNSSFLTKTDRWDLQQGDYKVEEYYKKPLKVHSEYNKIIVFASFSFTIIFTIATVIFILTQIAKI